MIGQIFSLCCSEYRVNKKDTPRSKNLAEEYYPKKSSFISFILMTHCVIWPHRNAFKVISLKHFAFINICSVSLFWSLWYFIAVAGFPVQLVIRNLFLLQVFYVLSGCKYSVNIKLQYPCSTLPINAIDVISILTWNCLSNCLKLQQMYFWVYINISVTS